MFDSGALIRPALCAALLGLLPLATAPAAAQTYPSGSMKLIVPVPAGGVTDIMARIVAQRLGESLNQTVIVDNRPGGCGLDSCRFLWGFTRRQRLPACG